MYFDYISRMKRAIFLFFLYFLPVLCRAEAPGDIIPSPSIFEVTKGSLRMSGISVKCDSEIGERATRAAGLFASKLSMACGKVSAVSSPVGLKATVESNSAKGLIIMKDSGMGAEEYSIAVDTHCAIVKAGGFNGFLYAFQTLMQMLPEEIYSGRLNEKARWSVPCCTIKDAPRNRKRTAFLDSGNNFHPVKDVKKCIDLMSIFKMNVLELNIAGKKGWRMEIPEYPLLTQISAYHYENDERTGGYYSKEDIASILNYASASGIEVVPIVDFDGCAEKIASAYPKNDEAFRDDVRSGIETVFARKGAGIRSGESPEALRIESVDKVSFSLIEAAAALWSDGAPNAMMEHEKAVLHHAGFIYTE